MICQPCRVPDHEACESPNCGCRHRGSTVRPLTGNERHLRANGLALPVVLPLDTQEDS
jgi:hypothetical protein